MTYHQSYADVKRMQRVALGVIPQPWISGGIGVAIGEQGPFLTVRVHPGLRDDAIEELHSAGLKKGFEVIESRVPEARTANPSLPPEPIRPYRYPVLPQPIPEQQFVDEIAELIDAAKLNRDGVAASIWLWDPLDAEHSKNPRRYAQVIPELKRFEFARATLVLPYCHRRGLIAHELGHVLDPQGGEDDADEAAHRVLGIKIDYDKRWPGKGLQVAHNCRSR